MYSAAQSELFGTKGMEYIVVIGFLLLLTVAWRLIRAPAGELAAATERLRSDWQSVLRGVGIPSTDLFFHPGHTWARITEDGGEVLVGWDDFARRLVGPAEGFRLPAPGTSLSAGTPAWAVSTGGQEMEMLAPIDGDVSAVNDAVLADPALASRDPYGAGWLLRLRPRSPESVPRNLLGGSLARSWSELAERSLHSLAGRAPDSALGVVLADGGEPSAGLARVLAPDDWERVVRTYFLLDRDVVDEQLDACAGIRNGSEF